MDNNMDQKPETTKQTNKRSDMAILLELHEEYEKLMKKKGKSYDTDYGMIPAGSHFNYINA